MPKTTETLFTQKDGTGAGRFANASVGEWAGSGRKSSDANIGALYNKLRLGNASFRLNAPHALSAPSFVIVELTFAEELDNIGCY